MHSLNDSSGEAPEMATYDARQVANVFLELAETEGEKITPLKLQKLIYCAHGWKLAVDGKPLLAEPVQAWRHGPVVESAYKEFREFGANAIDRLARNVDRIQDPFDLDLLRAAWNSYKRYTALELSAMTHELGTPWTITAQQDGGPRKQAIDNELIRNHFTEIIR